MQWGAPAQAPPPGPSGRTGEEGDAGEDVRERGEEEEGRSTVLPDWARWGALAEGPASPSLPQCSEAERGLAEPCPLGGHGHLYPEGDGARQDGLPGSDVEAPPVLGSCLSPRTTLPCGVSGLGQPPPPAWPTASPRP